MFLELLSMKRFFVGMLIILKISYYSDVIMLDYFAVAGPAGTPCCSTNSSRESTRSTERSKSSTGKHCDSCLLLCCTCSMLLSSAH